MVKETKYLKAIEKYIKKQFKREKIEQGINIDFDHKKISLETYNKAKKLLDERFTQESGKKEEKNNNSIRTNIKVIIDPKEEENLLKLAMGHHKINVTKIKQNDGDVRE